VCVCVCVCVCGICNKKVLEKKNKKKKKKNYYGQTGGQALFIVNQHTTNDGWKVVRKQLSVGVPIS
jgi:hypothetical protein